MLVVRRPPPAPPRRNGIAAARLPSHGLSSSARAFSLARQQPFIALPLRILALCVLWFGWRECGRCAREFWRFSLCVCAPSGLYLYSAKQRSGGSVAAGGVGTQVLGAALCGKVGSAPCLVGAARQAPPRRRRAGARAREAWWKHTCRGPAAQLAARLVARWRERCAKALAPCTMGCGDTDATPWPPMTR